MSSPEITRLVSRTRRPRQIRRQSRRRIRRRDHHQPRIRNQRRSRHRRTRTRRPDHTHHRRISHNRLRRRLTTIRRTQIIQTSTQRNRTTRDRPVISNRQLHTPLIRNPQESHIPRNRIQRPDLDLLTRTNLNSTQHTRREGLSPGRSDFGLSSRRSPGGVRRGLASISASTRHQHQTKDQESQRPHGSTSLVPYLGVHRFGADPSQPDGRSDRPRI